MKDLKDAIKDAGLQTDFGLTEIGKFDPLCSGCTRSCAAACIIGCYPSCEPGNSKGNPQE
jgi:hypothetical protein